MKKSNLNCYSTNGNEDNIEIKKNSNLSNYQNHYSSTTLNSNDTLSEIENDIIKNKAFCENDCEEDVVLQDVHHSSSMSISIGNLKTDDIASSSNSSSTSSIMPSSHEEKIQHQVPPSSLLLQQETNKKNKNKCQCENNDNMEINNGNNESSYRDYFYDASEYSCDIEKLQRNNDEIMERSLEHYHSSSSLDINRKSSCEDLNNSVDEDYESCEYSMSDNNSDFYEDNDELHHDINSDDYDDDYDDDDYDDSEDEFDDDDDYDEEESEEEEENINDHHEKEEEKINDEKLQQQQQNIRKQIINIQKDTTLTESEKARKIQNLMTSSYNSKQKVQNSNITNFQPKEKVDYDKPLTKEEKEISYYNKENGILGCKHYQRALKIQAHCCGKYFPCRFCHDEVSDHSITSKALTVKMMCMYCTTVQPVNDVCINPNCGKRVARYYCPECKLWDNDPNKNIYHCYDCGICRIGKGLGIDYFHCKTCNVCMSISLKGHHKCIERNLESNCPICGEYMFTSTTTVIFMPCGHCIHHKCYKEYIRTSYQCPTCFKSLANMSEYFKRIDQLLAQQKMPEEYNNWKSYILCNDCEKKSYAKFHFIYHKCAYCSSYNTKLIKTLDAIDAAKLPPDPNHINDKTTTNTIITDNTTNHDNNP